MITRQLQSLRDRLKRLYETAANIEDLYVQSQFARYLCILTLGYVEQSAKMLLTQYAENHANKEVASYVDFASERFSNPNFERLAQLCGAVSGDWRTEFEGAVKASEIQALNSVQALRLPLAHGVDIPLSLGTMSDYYKKILAVVDALETVMEP